MASISNPPTVPPDDIAPVFTTLDPGVELRRIYKDKDGRTEKTFNYKGLYGRFDHHRGAIANLQIDPDRGTSYWGKGDTLSCCLVEVFGDQKFITQQDRKIRRAALMILSEPILLLDLRGSGAMRIGTTAKLAKDGSREVTQAWSRYFYDNITVFKTIEGIIYNNSHNDEVSICFYERVIPKLASSIVESINLDNTAIQSEIQQACQDNGMKYL